jgi:hypothetical protein
MRRNRPRLRRRALLRTLRRRNDLLNCRLIISRTLLIVRLVPVCLIPRLCQWCSSRTGGSSSCQGSAIICRWRSSSIRCTIRGIRRPPDTKGCRITSSPASCILHPIACRFRPNLKGGWWVSRCVSNVDTANCLVVKIPKMWCCSNFR